MSHAYARMSHISLTIALLANAEVYHPNLPPHNDGNRSWSEPWDTAGAKLCNCPVDPAHPNPRVGGEMWASRLMPGGSQAPFLIGVPKAKLKTRASSTTARIIT